MKKLLLFLLLAPVLCFGQTEIGNFKIKDGQVIWQKVYEEDLQIESQNLKLQAIGLPVMTTTFWLTDISGADLVVEKKDGRTRLTVRKIYSISSVSITIGDVQENVTPTYLEEIYVKKRNGEFRNSFIKKDGKLINDIIEREINALLPSNDDDNW
jgi:hypothetical protein